MRRLRDRSYDKEEWMGKCRQWCEQHQSCNPQIPRHAVPLEADRHKFMK